ncbi:unnamed protein product [Symbiodinium natans]|uniref:Uncharacterized protein n=1 Tax=Symbiodinium natans TaxID=878477 RepID=A0A812GZV7_9DINO|nr:unnamed protein product [Symbiodinium natans]
MRLQDWVAAMLTGPASLSNVISAGREDLDKAYDWPASQEEAKMLLAGKALSCEATTERLVEALGSGRTALRPVHLAVFLDQLWALQQLLQAGAKMQDFETEVVISALPKWPLQKAAEPASLRQILAIVTRLEARMEYMESEILG